jgi:hypothetical protein
MGQPHRSYFLPFISMETITANVPFFQKWPNLISLIQPPGLDGWFHFTKEPHIYIFTVLNKKLGFTPE